MSYVNAVSVKTPAVVLHIPVSFSSISHIDLFDVLMEFLSLLIIDIKVFRDFVQVDREAAGRHLLVECQRPGHGLEQQEPQPHLPDRQRLPRRAGA